MDDTQLKVADLAYHATYHVCRIEKIVGDQITIVFPRLQNDTLLFENATVPASQLKRFCKDLLLSTPDIATSEESPSEKATDKIPATPFDGLPFDEVKALFIAKVRAHQSNDIRQLTRLLRDYPALFDETTFATLENVFKMMQRHIRYQKQAEADKKVVSLDHYRKK